MASLQALKMRIRCVESTKKVTKAMKMIASTSLRKTHAHLSENECWMKGFDQIFHAIYSEDSSKLCATINDMFIKQSKNCTTCDTVDEYGIVTSEEAKKRVRLFIVFTSDRGLCGHFNASIVKAMLHRLSNKQDAAILQSEQVLDDISYNSVGNPRIKSHDEYGISINDMSSATTDVQDMVICIGKRGYMALKNIAHASIEHASDLVLKVSNFSQDFVKKMEDMVTAYATKYHVLECYAVYNAFESVLKYNVQFETLWPLQRKKDISLRIAEDVAAGNLSAVGVMSYEPSSGIVLNFLKQHYLQVKFYSIALSTMLSEYSARMVAMEGAHKNSEEVIIKLLKKLNKIRQETITNELIEIIAGMQAMG